MAWIPVPNVVGLLSWMVEMCSSKMWKHCTSDLKCRTESLPSLLVQPPQRFLPELAGVEEEESEARLHYWGAILLLSPPMMAVICESMRLCFYCAKHLHGKLAKGSTSSTGYRQLELKEDERNDLESPMIATEPNHPFKGPHTMFIIPLMVYHLTCAGVVTLAIFKGWLLSDGGGLAWELWVVWQQLCLWNLFLQNLVRCTTLDSHALKASTCTTVLAYTAPFASEMADTMKDWVVTGLCILHAKTWIGFLIGAAIAGVEVSAIAMGWITLRKFSYSFVFLLALYIALFVVRFHLWVLIFGSIGGASLLFLMDLFNRSRWWGIVTGCDWRQLLPYIVAISFGLPICYMLITDRLRQIDSVLVNFSEETFWWLADGGLLAIVSIYVILHAHILVIRSEDCAQDLRKTYRAILELPLKPTNPGGEACCAWIGRRFTNLCVDFLSSARLLIAWSEDIPQGVIGVALVLRYAGPNGIGFAGISAIISTSKGVLIPILQRLVLEYRKSQVARGLDDILGTQQKAFLEKFLATSPVSHERIRLQVEEPLRTMSSDLLKRLNVDLVAEMQKMRHKWLADGGEMIRCEVVASYLNQGVSTTNLFDLGHMTGHCKNAGFSAGQCKEVAGFSAQKCKEAGFSPSDCKEAGFSYSECKDADFSIQECIEAGFTPMQCKEAGFVAKQCKEAGFSARDFKDAGFSAVQCKIVGFEETLCQEAGYTAEEWNREPTARDFKDAGFSAKECNKEYFTAKECKEAGFSMYAIGEEFRAEQLRKAGFFAKDFKDAGANGYWLKKRGFSAKECKEAGLSAMECWEAGFNPLDFKDAGFSAMQCKIVGFEVAWCKEADYSVEELACEPTAQDYKDAGMSAKECREAGFSPEQCKEVGYSAKECKEAGCSAKECKDAGFSAVQCRIVGFEVRMCQEAGYSTEELTREPTAQDYKTEGCFSECREIGGFSAKQAKDAGFSLKEIELAGYSFKEAGNAGFSAIQLTYFGMMTSQYGKNGLARDRHSRNKSSCLTM
ncbi:unnamed protein product [Durusdinium trenchii]|uniref:Uncharacterized protein n=1 Tax=Durusdinium trenchii TaxID=1381693 RepID=A0ABP0H7E5_9DINO